MTPFARRVSTATTASEGQDDAVTDDRQRGGSAPMSRRSALALATGAAGTLVLAGCGSSAAPPPSTGSTTAGGQPSPLTLVALADVPVGGAVSATSGQTPLVIAQPKAGTVVAFDATCTHLGCTVAPQGDQYVCPCHGSVYDAATGHVVSGVAPSPLAPFPVMVDAQGEVIAKT
jgi:cytochrome b6-f complex iron-sulfur subunit